jgi:hypothetical protein
VPLLVRSIGQQAPVFHHNATILYYGDPGLDHLPGCLIIPYS